MKTVRHFFLELWALMTLSLPYACTKETLYEADPTDVPDTSPLVTVIYDPDALGDRSYNDLIYTGVENAARKYGLRTMQLAPVSMEEGLAYLETVFGQMPSIQDTVRRLFIVTSPAYDEFLRKNNRRLEASPNADLLYLETTTPLEGKGSTLMLPYYGAMYEAGVLSSILYDSALLVGANPENESVKEAMDGFADGYDRKLITRYLGRTQEEGFSVADSTALKLLYAEDEVTITSLVIPVCGGAGSTLCRLVDIMGSLHYMGIDVDRSSRYCQISAVKHIDKAVMLCIKQWMSQEGMPKHQSFGLESGYTEVMLHPSFYESARIEGFEVTGEYRDGIRREAIEKEAAYEK